MSNKPPSSFARLYELQEQTNQKQKESAGDHPEWVATGYPHATHIQEVATHIVQETITKEHKKKDRHSKAKIQLGIRQSIVIVERAKDFCHATGVALQDLYELAVTRYLDEVGSHKDENVGSMLPHDDLMIFKTHDDIIMRYERLTGRKWKASDDRAATPFNNVDHGLIEIGMIHTYIQAKGKKINSFAYFIPEIQTMIDANFDRSNLDVYLKARRKLLLSWMKKQGKEPIAFWDSEKKKQKG